MHKIIHLMLVLSMVLLPIQHLLAAQSCHSDNTISAEVHHTTSMDLHSAETAHCDVDKYAAECCEESGSCNYSSDITLVNHHSVQAKFLQQHNPVYSTIPRASALPERRPPRNT